jgi:hypothetical protein
MLPTVTVTIDTLTNTGGSGGTGTIIDTTMIVIDVWRSFRFAPIHRVCFRSSRFSHIISLSSAMTCVVLWNCVRKRRAAIAFSSFH